MGLNIVDINFFLFNVYIRFFIFVTFCTFFNKFSTFFYIYSVACIVSVDCHTSGSRTFMELPVLAVSCGSYRTIIVIILFIQTCIRKYSVLSSVVWLWCRVHGNTDCVHRASVIVCWCDGACQCQAGENVHFWQFEMDSMECGLALSDVEMVTGRTNGGVC